MKVRASINLEELSPDESQKVEELSNSDEEDYQSETDSNDDLPPSRQIQIRATMKLTPKKPAPRPAKEPSSGNSVKKARKAK